MGQIDERVDAGVDERADFLPRPVNGFERERVLTGEQSALLHPPGVHELVVRPVRAVVHCVSLPDGPGDAAVIPSPVAADGITTCRRELVGGPVIPAFGDLPRRGVDG